jgi:hypothetical protein
MRTCGSPFLALASLLACAGVAHAAPEEKPAVFALIVGVNRSVDSGLAPLAYADDDAALYLELFRSLGAHAVLLSSFDENTRRLHPQAVAEAKEPTRREMVSSAQALSVAVMQARRRGVQTILYVVYAGHGNAERGEGYVSLQDGRFYGRELGTDVVQRIAADRTHLIVDACQAYFLVHGRGPGGERRVVSGFSRMALRPEFRDVGLILATSSGKESHEWEGFQAGVFSHEVRSGLYGGADVDGDGLVTYRELGAFVRRANETIPNERYRPELFIRPAVGNATLVDLRRGMSRAIRIDGTLHGRWVVEDEEGVRLIDLHSAAGHPARLLRPARPGTLYVRRHDDGREYSVSAADGPTELAALAATTSSTRTRGAADHAFRRAFERPFDRAAVAAFRYSSLSWLQLHADRGDFESSRSRKRIAVTLATVGAATAAGAAALGGTALAIGQAVDDAASQREAAEANTRIRWLNRGAVVLGAAGGAAVLAGLGFWLWPEAPMRPVVGVGIGGEATSAGVEIEF